MKVPNFFSDCLRHRKKSRKYKESEVTDTSSTNLGSEVKFDEKSYKACFSDFYHFISGLYPDTRG